MANTEAVSDAQPFRVDEYHGWTLVTFKVESLMEPAALERISKALYPIVDEQSKGRLILDFKHVRYLSSQAIGILLTVHKKVAAQPKGEMVLCGVDAKLMQLLKITRLDRLLRITPTRREAVGTD